MDCIIGNMSSPINTIKIHGLQNRGRERFLHSLASPSQSRINLININVSWTCAHRFSSDSSSTHTKPSDRHTKSIRQEDCSKCCSTFRGRVPFSICVHVSIYFALKSIEHMFSLTFFFCIIVCINFTNEQ